MKNATLLSAIIYTGLSLLAAGLFILVTMGSTYTLVDRFGGAAWVFLLCMIILMPVIIPLIKKKLQ
ncbi:MAG: hypothetical protein PHN75_05545 [Syntrophales bacterium]|nr:hypothetical protein [Syntrophales bacterium]